MPSAPAAGIVGDWKMSVKTDHGPMAFALVLEQDASIVTGTVSSDHSGTLPLHGKFVDGALTFFTTAMDGTALELTGSLKDDGTLAGELSGPMGHHSWTAERVKKP
jgi:hypothetical protein